MLLYYNLLLVTLFLVVGSLGTVSYIYVIVCVDQAERTVRAEEEEPRSAHADGARTADVPCR